MTEATRLIITKACVEANVFFDSTVSINEVTPDVYLFVSSTKDNPVPSKFHAIVKGLDVTIERA